MLGEPGWQGLLKLGSPRSYEPGDRLLHQGQQGSEVLALVSGRVAVVLRKENGERMMLALRGAGDLVGEYAAPTREGRIADVVAVDRCRTSVVLWPVMEHYLNKTGCALLLNGYVRSKSYQSAHRMDRKNLPTECQIARFLLELAELADASLPAPEQVPFPQSEIGPLLNMARSTVMANIKSLKAMGALRGRQNELFIGNKAVLRSAAGV
ncbi:Crp/Fnr family transcriptional regulator [Actinosynnema pretiosum subsp. pretiosum]